MRTFFLVLFALAHVASAEERSTSNPLLMAPLSPLKVKQKKVDGLFQKPPTPAITLSPSTFEKGESNAWDRLSVRYVIPERGGEFIPKLYYTHAGTIVGSDEEMDSWGRKWKLSRRTDMVFPFCRWDSPTARRERLLIGVGFVWTFH